ncbi:hypothetical protein K6V26_04925 [Parabacteroides goldsteinii]|uniref:hypothetical protein n=1 Tax=Parabacteroides goldsteinii TaxID=328812 RepID=UPI001CCB41E5|nr:hypothetical protein [Parabacteroides goldsteinii]UBD75690.1 hypothetical protein K6V26_04925 [Parabacteroides goldsteinii]
MNQYSVERRGAKYYLYDPKGTKMDGQSAFPWERKKVAKMFALASELNQNAECV